MQEVNGVDLTGDHQQGFKRNRSTSALTAALLSQILREFDDKDYVIVASLELSSTFDPVNVKNLENNWLSK
jgi:hypothetical protein